MAAGNNRAGPRSRGIPSDSNEPPSRHSTAAKTRHMRGHVRPRNAAQQRAPDTYSYAPLLDSAFERTGRTRPGRGEGPRGCVGSFLDCASILSDSVWEKGFRWFDEDSPCKTRNRGRTQAERKARRRRSSVSGVLKEEGNASWGKNLRMRLEPDTGISAATESKTSRENTRHSDESTDAAVSSRSDREPVGYARQSLFDSLRPRMHRGSFSRCNCTSGRRFARFERASERGARPAAASSTGLDRPAMSGGNSESSEIKASQLEVTTLDLAALAAYGGVSGPRVAVAGTGVLALPGLIPDKGLSSPGGQSKGKSAGLAGLDSEAVRRWVAEAARTVRQIPPPVVVPSSSSQQQQQHQHRHQQHHSIHRQRQESSPPLVGSSPFGLPSSMTQTPSMHLLENNNLVEVAMAQQQSQQQMQMQQQKQKQTSPTNNNTIEAWRSIQGGHQWWSPPSNVHQEQQVSPIGQQVVSQPQSMVVGSVCGQAQRQSQIHTEIDQPLDFSVGSLEQQRLHSRVRTMHGRLQGRMHDNNNGTASAGQKIARGTGSRRSYSPSEGSSSSSEDEGVSTGGSPSGPLRGTENGASRRPPLKDAANWLGIDFAWTSPIWLRFVCELSSEYFSDSRIFGWLEIDGERRICWRVGMTQEIELETEDSVAAALFRTNEDNSEGSINLDFRLIFTGKIWIGDNEVAWRTEQSFKRTSPLNPCATTTTTTTTGGGAPAHPHLSPPIAAPVTTPDHRSPSSLHVKLGISPGEYTSAIYLKHS
ncbi:hypothetical protein WH47_08316 [Habropoda laboriosa]|uniref:Uncharacterized protein n=1 Tax=Habropoda laboriosa TaxID=597456 RepID=A0A0L7RGS1_9HYME|nr:hypothetical protein WH47_08316 [Habropoda laboriosa]